MTVSVESTRIWEWWVAAFTSASQVPWATGGYRHQPEVPVEVAKERGPVPGLPALRSQSVLTAAWPGVGLDCPHGLSSQGAPPPLCLQGWAPSVS